MKRLTKAVLGGLATSALILGATQTATGESPIIRQTISAPLVDLQPNQEGPFDGASATLVIIETPEEGTGFILTVDGIDSSVADEEFGAHLHVGPCVEPTKKIPNPTAGHYQDDPSGGVNPENEVWFDLVPNDLGVAKDESWVSFVPQDPDGVMSIVIHVDDAAKSSPKQACLPLLVSDWTL